MDTPPLCAPWSAPETIVGSEGTVKGSAKNLQTWLLCMFFRLSGKWFRFVRSAPFAVFRLSGIVRVLCVLCLMRLAYVCAVCMCCMWEISSP